MKDKDLQKIANIFKKLRNTIKDVNIHEDIDQTHEEINKVVERLFSYVNGKITKKYNNYGTQTILSSLDIEGEVNGYEVYSTITLNDEIYGLGMLVEDLTMAYWRAVLNRDDFNTYELIEQILSN